MCAPAHLSRRQWSLCCRSILPNNTHTHTKTWNWNTCARCAAPFNGRRAWFQDKCLVTLMVMLCMVLLQCPPLNGLLFNVNMCCVPCMYVLYICACVCVWSCHSRKLWMGENRTKDSYRLSILRGWDIIFIAWQNVKDITERRRQRKKKL